MRHSSFRWLASLLALALTVGSGAVSALRAQDRSAAAPARPWWQGPAPAPAPAQPNGIQPAAASSATPAAAPPKSYRLVRDLRGESKPLIIDADEITTWTEKVGGSDYCVFLLRGLVFAQQGIVQARFKEGVAWVDLGRYRVTGKLRTEIYAEGEVRIDDGTTIHDYPRVVLDLTTRGEFKINAHRVPLIRQTRAEDPLVQRGRGEGLGPRFRQAAPPAPQPSPLQRASFQERNLILPPTVTPLGRPGPAPSPNLQPSPPLPQRPVGTPAPRAPATQEHISFAAPPGDPLRGGNAAPTPSAAGPVTIAPPSQAGPPTATPTALPGDGPQPPMPETPANTSPRAPDGSVPPSGPTRVPPGTPPVPPPSRPIKPPSGQPIQVTPNFIIGPRQSGKQVKGSKVPGPNGESVYIITGGVMLQVRNAKRVGMIDMEADRIVVWTHGGGDLLAESLQHESGHNSKDLEVYLSGNVVIRQAPILNLKGDQRTIYAEEVYYDVNRSVAIAKEARLVLKQPLMNDPIVASAKEIRQTSINTYEILHSEVFSSRLPSDPGLKVYMQDGLIEDNVVPLRNILGQPVLDRTTGQPVMRRESLITGNNAFFEMEKIPFFYLPYVSTTLQEPLGPIQNFTWGFNHIFGMQLGVSLNAYEIFGLQPRPNSRWLLNLDYLSYRGPGIGTLYNTSGTDLFGIPAKYTSVLRGFGMIDRGYDNLGGTRPINNFQPTNFRGWLLERGTAEDMPYGFSSLLQISPVSDRNFIEQYYKRAWDVDPNFDTFLFVKQQQDNWQWTGLVRPRLRDWVTMTQDLPRFDGWLIGQDFFKLFVYTSHVNAEYASLQTSDDRDPIYNMNQQLIGYNPLPQVSVTDQNVSTFRGSWMQEVNVPFYLGPLKLSPYGRSELTGYSRDLQGNPIGRSWEAGGVRASIPFTHLYSGVTSELFNVNGLNHKVVLNANYVYAYTNVPYTLLPQLDRLNDDATNQALRDIKPWQWIYNPNGVFGNHGLSLLFSPYFNTPQTMAIRRLLFDRAIDTLSTVEQLQLQLSQRLQTKRGFPGNQHIVDWMSLDLWASYFPAYNRDNFGHPWSFLQYSWLWNIGDRTALTSTGWTDPFPGGVRMWTVGSYFNRPDRTNFYLGFRYIDPLMVRAVTASVTYVFSPKYAATASSTYDFGTGEAFANSLMFTRMGSDLQVSLGVSYNALQSNFNFLFNIVPNLLPANRATGPIGSSGAGQQGVLNSNF